MPSSVPASFFALLLNDKYLHFDSIRNRRSKSRYRTLRTLQTLRTNGTKLTMFTKGRGGGKRGSRWRAGVIEGPDAVVPAKARIHLQKSLARESIKEVDSRLRGNEGAPEGPARQMTQPQGPRSRMLADSWCAPTLICRLNNSSAETVISMCDTFLACIYQ